VTGRVSSRIGQTPERGPERIAEAYVSPLLQCSMVVAWELWIALAQL
jgi:hypothetical protein